MNHWLVVALLLFAVITGTLVILAFVAWKRSRLIAMAYLAIAFVFVCPLVFFLGSC